MSSAGLAAVWRHPSNLKLDFQMPITPGRMNQRLWTSLTTALLLTASWPIASSHAAQNQTVNKGSEAHLSPANSTGKQKTARLPSTPSRIQPHQAIEVAQSNAAAIAKVYPHVVAGRQAATLYVRNIPVLTFLSSTAGATEPASRVDNSRSKMGQAGEGKNTPARQTSQTQNASKQGAAVRSASQPQDKNPNQARTAANPPDKNDPMWRASELAAQLNRLKQENLDPNTITVTPDEGDNYLIKVNGKDLIAIDAVTILPDSTQNRAEDALQATNRLRRQMGNAPPLAEIPGMPKPKYAVQPKAPEIIATGPILYSMSGMASWYGPGFDGNMSASGEIFDQNELTAAHLDLPFGTRVKVTNLDNGLSVVVRINDRGPYAEDRIIDLSAGAAQMLGMMQTGVAPVSLEVLGSQNTAAK